MTLATLITAIFYVAGIAMVIVGIRSAIALPWSPHQELRPDSELRRRARIERIEDARKRRDANNTPDAA